MDQKKRSMQTVCIETLSLGAFIATMACVLHILAAVGSLLSQPSLHDPLRRVYSCTSHENGSYVEPSMCPGLGGPCPMIADYDEDCRSLCNQKIDCRAVVFEDSRKGSGYPGACYMYSHDQNIVVVGSSPLRQRLQECTATIGCPPSAAASNSSVILVLVLKYETHTVRNWLFYHAALGIRHFVIISNECDEQAHLALLAAVASAPCNPRLTFIHSFRCSGGFQGSAYTEAARVLLHEGVPSNSMVGYWDVDEYLVIQKLEGREVAQTSAIESLLQRGPPGVAQWVFSVKPFGPALHESRTFGFTPANFLFGSDLESSSYGAYPKSLCRLSAMRVAIEEGEPLFCPPWALKPSKLCGNWPHHCFRVTDGSWSVPRSAARLNHYCTKEEGEWRAKCSRPNPTFRGNSRAGRQMCENLEAFFAGISHHTDLQLFESLNAALGGAVPTDFLARSQLAPAAQAKLRSHCNTLNLGTNVGHSALSMLCNASAAPDVDAVLDGCMYNCSSGKKARAVAGARAPLGDGMTRVRSAEAQSESEQKGNICDCARLQLDFGVHRQKCKHSHRANTDFCWLFCCRPDKAKLINNALSSKPPSNTSKSAHIAKHFKDKVRALLSSQEDIEDIGDRAQPGRAFKDCSVHEPLITSGLRSLDKWQHGPLSEEVMRRHIDSGQFPLTVAVRGGKAFVVRRTSGDNWSATSALREQRAHHLREFLIYLREFQVCVLSSKKRGVS